MDQFHHGTKRVLDTWKLFPKEANLAGIQLHGFCDASERAYAGVVYIRATDTMGIIHVSLVVAKTKVATIRHLTIPPLELCGALVMVRLLKHTSRVLSVPKQNTLGRIVVWSIGWLCGDLRRFKVFVGNRSSFGNFGVDSAKLLAACT